MAAVDGFLILVVCVVINHVWSLQVIPERANVVSINAKYVSDVKFYVKRYKRRGNYYINLEGTIKDVWANNISAHFLFYEYLHNEYKRSFVEMHFKYCDLLHSDPYVGKALAETGVTCPAPPGVHKLSNISVPANDFPNVWPFERCRVDITVQQTPTQDIIGLLHIYVYFKK